MFRSDLGSLRYWNSPRASETDFGPISRDLALAIRLHRSDLSSPGQIFGFPWRDSVMERPVSAYRVFRNSAADPFDSRNFASDSADSADSVVADYSLPAAETDSAVAPDFVAVGFAIAVAVAAGFAAALDLCFVLSFSAGLSAVLVTVVVAVASGVSSVARFSF